MTKKKKTHCCCGKRHVRVADSSSTREVCGYPDQGVFAPKIILYSVAKPLLEEEDNPVHAAIGTG